MSKYAGIIGDLVTIDLSSDEPEEFVRLAGKATQLLGKELVTSSASRYAHIWEKFKVFCLRKNKDFLPALADIVVCFLRESTGDL